MDDRIPKLLEVALIARHLGWPTRKTRERFRRAKMAESFPGCGELMVPREVFAAQLPVLYKSFCEDYLAGKLRSKRGDNRRKT